MKRNRSNENNLIENCSLFCFLLPPSFSFLLLSGHGHYLFPEVNGIRLKVKSFPGNKCHKDDDDKDAMHN